MEVGQSYKTLRILGLCEMLFASRGEVVSLVVLTNKFLFFIFLIGFFSFFTFIVHIIAVQIFI